MCAFVTAIWFSAWCPVMDMLRVAKRKKRIVSRVSEPIRQLTFSVLKFLFFFLLFLERKNNVATTVSESRLLTLSLLNFTRCHRTKKKSSGSALLPAYIDAIVCGRVDVTCILLALTIAIAHPKPPSKTVRHALLINNNHQLQTTKIKGLAKGKS